MLSELLELFELLLFDDELLLLEGAELLRPLLLRLETVPLLRPPLLLRELTLLLLPWLPLLLETDPLLRLLLCDLTEGADEPREAEDDDLVDTDCREGALCTELCDLVAVDCDLLTDDCDLCDELCELAAGAEDL